MSDPDSAAVPDVRPIEPGEVFENPVTLEWAVLIEAPWWNDEGRAVADMTALPGARVVGEHLHPVLHESFTVRDGELTVVRDGQRSIVRAGERAQIKPGVWHDWWNEGHVDALVRVDRCTPGRANAWVAPVSEVSLQPANSQLGKLVSPAQAGDQARVGDALHDDPQLLLSAERLVVALGPDRGRGPVARPGTYLRRSPEPPRPG